MYPGAHAREHPEKVATVMAGSGEVIRYGDLDRRSNRCARLFRALGLAPGDAIALAVENRSEFFDLCWGAQRAGLRYTPCATHLQAEELAYITADCGARVFVSSGAFSDRAPALAERLPDLRARLSLDGGMEGFESLEDALAAQPDAPLDEEVEGTEVLYSSGTTGRPKGIVNAFEPRPIGTPPPLVRGLLAGMFGAGPETVYLSPAPLYHSAPLRFTMAMHRLGATNVVMERFDPAAALAAIERQRVTLSQWVPTMFVRLLKLPAAERERFDLSSHQVALHAAAPCPPEVKQRMIEWWGPILIEYYAATEGNGSTRIDSAEWLAHRGSVGRPLDCEVHIVGDDGEELPPGEVGTIYFGGGAAFEYHNDPDKTAAARHPKGWSTVGDVGYVDDEGYLYLTDRKDHMIVSGGVNIYPQETENELLLHPAVADAAVLGVPHPEFGEEVKAVVEPVDMARAGPALERELIAWCRARLSPLKCPRSVDFERSLPRGENGKLYKRLLKDRYWRGHETRIL